MTPLEWLSIIRDPDLDLGSGNTAYGRASRVSHRPVSTYQISLKSEKYSLLDRLTAGTPPSSRSRDTKTRTNCKKPARSNLDIVL